MRTINQVSHKNLSKSIELKRNKSQEWNLVIFSTNAIWLEWVCIWVWCTQWILFWPRSWAMSMMSYGQINCSFFPNPDYKDADINCTLFKCSWIRMKKKKTTRINSFKYTKINSMDSIHRDANCLVGFISRTSYLWVSSVHCRPMSKFSFFSTWSWPAIKTFGFLSYFFILRLSCGIQVLFWLWFLCVTDRFDLCDSLAL